jgi:hypothetical protein
MQNDTRRLTVARDHLRAAYEEVTRAQGQAERSMAEAAAGRALSHLDLVWKRLEHERQVSPRKGSEQAVERAYTASRSAWQGVHNVLNRWPASPAAALDPVREQVIAALEAVDEAVAQEEPEQVRVVSGEW